MGGSRMRVGWLADPAGQIIGGAELAGDALQTSAPEGWQIVPCPPGAIEPADAYVVMNCVGYDAAAIAALSRVPVIKVVSDWWEWGDPELRAWLLRESALVVLRSPLHRSLFPFPIDAPVELLPSPLTLRPFRDAALPPEERNGRAVWIGQMTSGWKGEQQAARWAEAQRIHLDVHGAGPYAPQPGAHVHLKGQLAYEQVPQLLGSYSWFVFLPQRPGSFGRTLVEAWAAGCALVTNRNSGALLWIEHRPDELDLGATRFWESVEHALGRVTHGAPQHRRADGPGRRTGGRRGAPLVWSAPLLDTSGYAEEARTLVLGLDEAGADVLADPLVAGSWGARLTTGAAERIERLTAVEPPERFVHVVHATPPFFLRHPRATRSIGRTMLETDSVPAEWVARCNELDEIWVPSAFNADTFVRSGVEPQKLRRIPSPLPAGLYGRAPEPLPLPLQGTDGVVFLSVLEWGLRKGWDVLVRAFLAEFTAADGVSLVLKVSPPIGRTAADVRTELEAFLSAWATDPSDRPPIVILEHPLGDEEMARLYAAADAYVAPTRGEGWGRPIMEAMASGLPTIATRWSGHLDYATDDNAYLVDCELVDVPPQAWAEQPAFRGGRWAEPSEEHLRSLMRHVLANREEAAARGAKAQCDVLGRFSVRRVAEEVLDALGDHTGPRRPRPRRPEPAPVRVNWEGDQFVEHSLALVNRDLCRALLGTGRVELGLVTDHPLDPAPSLAALAARVGPLDRPDAHVRHAWPPDFERPSEGRFVLVQPWEYGAVPSAWVEPLQNDVDELWVPSTYVRDCYVRSGIDGGKVVVVPNGVDPLLFNPGAAPLTLPTEKRLRFLFVGGTIARKGADVLLEAYTRAFGPADDVCLVVKDFGTDSFYRGQGLGDEIRRLQEAGRSAEIVYLDGTLPRESMPALYRSCHCLVHPYRGEGFALPVAEAMACGLAVVVTGHGACLDFCDSTTAYLVPAREVRLPEAEVGGVPTVEAPWWAEPDVEALVRILRGVAERPQDAAALGRRASTHVLRKLAWRHAADVALERLAPGRRQVRPAPRSPGEVEGSSARLLSGITVCLMVRDEEESIGACLRSVAGVADQVVVVDTGSTDSTREIARRHGAEVHELEWRDDFAAARNEALRHARHAWILVLDADERLDAASHDRLRSLTRGDVRAGYLVRMRNYLEDTGDDAVLEHLNLRLFPNEPGLRYVGRDPHSQVGNLGAETLPLLPSEILVHHDGYRPRTFAARRKGARNVAALERAVRQEPGNPFHAYNLGVAYGLDERDAEAEIFLLRSIALLLPEVHTGSAPSYLSGAYVSLGLSLFRQGRFVEAAAYGEAAARIAPSLADAHLLVGASRSRIGEFERALASFSRALGADGRGPEASDLAASTWKPRLGIGEVHLLRREWAEALRAFDLAQELAPEDPGVGVARARALIGLGRVAEAEHGLRRAMEAGAAEDDAWLVLAELQAAEGRADEAAATLRDGLFRHPEAQTLLERLAALNAQAAR